MRSALLAVAAYSIACGALVCVFPTAPFAWLGLEPPVYMGILQSAGLFAGVFGIGYLIASVSPLRYWPVVLIGLLSKIGGASELLWAAVRKTLPWQAASTIVAIELTCCIPLALILRATADDFFNEEGRPSEPRDRMMLKHMTQQGYSLFELSQLQPTLAVFLRHAGCTFCRETLSEISVQRSAIEAAGAQLVFVTMSEEPSAQHIFERYGLGDQPRISDPECELYRSFDLRRGRWREMLAPGVWWRGFKAGVLRGNGIGALDGDGFRMPGVFLIRDGVVLRSYRHASPADRPNYIELALCDECSPHSVKLEPRLAS